MSTEPKSGARITVRAQTPIAAGQEVTVHYISFMYGHFRSVSPALQGSAKMLWPSLVNFVTAVAYHFCPCPLATQPGRSSLADPCSVATLISPEDSS